MLKEQTEAVWPGLGWGTDMRSEEGSGGEGWAVFGAVGFRSECYESPWNVSFSLWRTAQGRGAEAGRWLGHCWRYAERGRGGLDQGGRDLARRFWECDEGKPTGFPLMWKTQLKMADTI